MEQQRRARRSNGTVGIGVPRARGLTLVELVFTLSVSAVLLAAATSAVVIASHAVPDRQGAAAGVARAASALEDMAADLRFAYAVTEASPTATTIVLPDQDGDGADETIRYAWSGTPGDPLTCQRGSATPSAVCADVRELSLAYETSAEALPTTNVEGPEVLLSSYVGTASLADYTLNTNIWVGQYFKPALPTGAVSWRITRVQLYARANGSTTGVNYLQVRAGQNTTASVLEQVAMPESGLPTAYAWKEYAFMNAGGISPTAGAYLVATLSANGAGGDLRYQSMGVAAANASFVRTSNGESGWVTESTKSLLYYAYGRVTAPAPQQYRYRVTGVRAAVRAGKDASARLERLLDAVNEPEETP
jgi:hypothetical protein